MRSYMQYIPVSVHLHDSYSVITELQQIVTNQLRAVSLQPHVNCSPTVKCLCQALQLPHSALQGDA